MSEITDIKAREILDSRGNPTVEVTVTLDGRVKETACSPSGASTGQYEALELRDGNIICDEDECREWKKRYMGKGVLQAVCNVNSEIKRAIIGKNVNSIKDIDELLINLDGTSDKKRLGANAVLAVSLAVAKAAAKAEDKWLYEYIGGSDAVMLPVPMMNILNGGAHIASKDSQDFQEFMIVPVGASCFREALRMGTEVYHNLKKVLIEHGHFVGVGDEGGFAPAIPEVDRVLDLLVEATMAAGYECGKDICFALDVAASEWKPMGNSEMMADERKITGLFTYHLPKSGKNYSSDELIDMYKNIVDKYPVISIEDPLDEEDWKGWKRITDELGDRVQLVGDDLFVTNTGRLAQGIEMGCGNSILIKLNQIGTLSETIDAITMAQKAGYTAIVSHRSGETEDTTIADLAVALNCGQIKTGAPCRSERVAKYNQLLRIEERLGDRAVYAGINAMKAHNAYF